MPGPQGRDNRHTSFDPTDGATHDGQLAELLANLKVDPGNPDLWMEAATIYLVLGRRRRASKAYRASIEVVHERKSEEAALVSVHRFLHGDEVPSGKDGGNLQPGAPAGHAAPPPPVSGKVQVQPSGSHNATTTEQRLSVAGDSNLLDQLRRELSPRRTVTCPDCNTLLEVGDAWCFGCGREVTESHQSLEERVVLARMSLAENEDDLDALFTLAAHLAVSGEHEEALEYLIRLTALDPRYPGLWWVKARVFLAAGKEDAARASLRMALGIMTDGGSEPRA
ncbi:MAG: hypothetical protein ACE5KQ_04445 [Thermoplasmata archaeon]